MLYEINEKVIRLKDEGRKIINFNLGDPDQPTPDEIIEAAYEAMKRGKTKYSSAAGEKKLRDRLADIHNVSVDNIVITNGSKWAIFSILFLLLTKGDNVVIQSPHWTSYELIARTLGAKIQFLKTSVDSDWQIDVEKFAHLLTKNTRLVILNSPNNPTSKIIDEKVLEEIVMIAHKKGIPLLSDEVYADISFVTPKSVMDLDTDAFIVKSFSKTFAMTGWRIGYAIVPKDLAEKMVKLNQITLTNVPVFNQYAALKALELKPTITKRIRAVYLRRANIACGILSKTKMSFSTPDAPFYIFPKYATLNSEDLAFNLLDRGVAITPGTAFGDYLEHFRISLTVPEKEIVLGLKKICETLQ